MIPSKSLDWIFFAVLETGRDNFSAPFLENLSGGLDYIWYCLPPQGRSGGILVGFNTQTLKVKNVLSGDRCVKFHLAAKSDILNGLWSLCMGLLKMQS
jgi:hypothetical protein